MGFEIRADQKLMAFKGSSVVKSMAEPRWRSLLFSRKASHGLGIALIIFGSIQILVQTSLLILETRFVQIKDVHRVSCWVSATSGIWCGFGVRFKNNFHLIIGVCWFIYKCMRNCCFTFYKICLRILRLALHSCILARVLLHNGACANAALLPYLLFFLTILWTICGYIETIILPIWIGPVPIHSRNYRSYLYNIWNQDKRQRSSWAIISWNLSVFAFHLWTKLMNYVFTQTYFKSLWVMAS